MTSEGTVCTGCGDPAVLLDRVPVGLTVAALCADCLMTYLGEVRNLLANMGVEVRHLREQAKENERLRAYAAHRPDCNLSRPDAWDEAAEALASCPDGPGKAEAEYELSVARSRCTCGLATPAPAGKGEG